MKKSLLAFTLVGTFAYSAVAQTNVTIYGVADAGIAINDSDAPTDARTYRLESGQQSGSRLGFRGTEDLGGGLSAIFTLENGFSIDNGQLGQGGRLFGRQAWVGLNGNFGAVKFGRQYNPIRPALESIDPFALGLAGNMTNVFLAYGERADNTINYSTPKFGGFSGQVAYSLGEIAGSTSAGRQAGLLLGYNSGPINVVLAYHDQNLATATGANSGSADTIMLGGTYDFSVAKLHAAYAVNKGETAAGATNVDSTDMMLGLTAKLGAGNVIASYMRKNNDLAGNGDSNLWAIGYTYDISKRTNLYTSYGRVKNDPTGLVGFGGPLTAAGAGRDPSTFNVGVRHRF
ncbi:porin [Noviherbaspirillum sp.]|uniref:porin n=1 Tax=Noviherbaspirillum sp. TaxID=1926288 RepID=UPI002FE14690